MLSKPSSLTKLGFDPENPDGWPTKMSGKEFLAAFPSESETVEFKQGLPDSAIEDDIVAFSNAQGGCLLAGVRDDGEVAGLECTSAVVDRVNSVARRAHSPGSVVARPLLVEDREITIVGVSRLRVGFAQTGKGRILVRRGTQRLALIGAELAGFIQGRAARSFENVALDVSPSSAAPDLRQTLASTLGAPGIADSDESLIERGLADRVEGKLRLTVLGALYLLERPDTCLGKAYIEILRFPVGSHNADRRIEVAGPTNRQVEEATRIVHDELGYDEVVLGLRRHELPRLPERVVREAIANAVAHRSYEQRGTPIRVELHPDRVEVVSPGGLIPPVTVERMRDQQAARNSKVIKILRAFSLAEDQGKGVDLIQDLMRDELLAQPEFRATEVSVSVVLPVLSGTSPAERAWVREVETRGKIQERDRVLLVYARRGEEITNRRARELLNASRDVATAALNRLTRAGLLERFGQRGGTRYRLALELEPPAGLSLNRAELKDLILGLAGEDTIANAKVRAATGLDRQDVLSLLDELVRDGELVRIGEKRGTRYLLVE